MRIVIVNFHEQYGGAAKAAHRLHKALRSVGVESWMLVHHENANDDFVIAPKTRWEKIRVWLAYQADAVIAKWVKKPGMMFNVNRFSARFVRKHIQALSPEVVHIHWAHRGMLALSELTQLTQPIVWTCHDMWPFTGGCHYDQDCHQYQTGCGRCPMLSRPSERDISAKQWQLKKAVFARHGRVYLLGVSEWMATCARTSHLVPAPHVTCLPNPIDTDNYAPKDKQVARTQWELPHDKKIILFGAVNAFSDKRKGFAYLREALAKLACPDEVLLLTFGGQKPNPSALPVQSRYVGEIQDEQTMVSLYSASDVLVLPSLQENLSNTLMESLSCGTPCVAFDVGGNRDLIIHKRNGYLAKPLDSGDLRAGIEWVLMHKEVLSKFARKQVLACFDQSKVALQYAQLYDGLLDKL